MRVPIPSRVNPSFAAMFIMVIFATEVIEGTNFIFALLVSLYLILWTAAFNRAGGLAYPTGAYILSNGLYCVIIGVTVKAILGQPADRNLLAPITTLAAYCLTMLMILIVCVLVKGLRVSDPLIKPYQSLKQLNNASIICLVFGIAANVVASGRGREGSAASAIAQLNQGIPALAIIFATTYVIKRTNGRRSVNWVVVVGICLYVVQGMVVFTKADLLFGFVAWLLAAIMQGYNFKIAQVTGLAVGMLFFTYYLVPYSQYVRQFRDQDPNVRVATAILYLSDLEKTRKLYYDAIEEVPITDEVHFFDKRLGFLDRTVIIAADDELINFTEHGHIFGVAPTLRYYGNIVPHFIWRNKPSQDAGNIYAHELGNILQEEDTTTGISFSIAAESFHQESWLGVMTLLPLNLFICFILYESLTGSGLFSPLALLPVFNMFVAGGEGGLGSPIYASTFGVVTILFVVFLTKTAGPLLVSILPTNRVPAQIPS